MKHVAELHSQQRCIPCCSQRAATHFDRAELLVVTADTMICMAWADSLISVTLQASANLELPEPFRDGGFIKGRACL